LSALLFRLVQNAKTRSTLMAVLAALVILHARLALRLRANALLVPQERFLFPQLTHANSVALQNSTTTLEFALLAIPRALNAQDLNPTNAQLALVNSTLMESAPVHQHVLLERFHHPQETFAKIARHLVPPAPEANPIASLAPLDRS
jgi:UDP-3-O-[3-hydroxymyristoyl] glucosamine N-acyltransferase